LLLDSILFTGVARSWWIFADAFNIDPTLIEKAITRAQSHHARSPVWLFM
jgi:hypothetical protein